MAFKYGDVEVDMWNYANVRMAVQGYFEGERGMSFPEVSDEELEALLKPPAPKTDDREGDRTSTESA